MTTTTTRVAPSPPRVKVEDWPRLTRFYGISPAELLRTPHAILEVYAAQLMELQAEETLMAMVVSDMPYMSDSDRKKARRPLARVVGGGEQVQKIDHTTEGGRATAAQLGIGVRGAIESTEESDPRKELK
jgi:hypothetical protein